MPDLLSLCADKINEGVTYNTKLPATGQNIGNIEFLHTQMMHMSVAGPEVKKGVSEMCAYLEDIVGDDAVKLAARLAQMSVSSSSPAANGATHPHEGPDQTAEQALRVNTPGTQLNTLVPHSTHICPYVEEPGGSQCSIAGQRCSHE